MINPRELLNEIKWKQGLDIKKVEIWYIHRGAKKNTRIISGKEIISIGISFLETTTSMIPYHRIFQITYNKETIFKRK